MTCVKNFETGCCTQNFFKVPHHILEQRFGSILFLMSVHDPLHAKQGLLGFLLVPSFLGISSGKWSPGTLFCTIFSVLTCGVFKRLVLSPSSIRILAIERIYSSWSNLGPSGP